MSDFIWWIVIGGVIGWIINIAINIAKKNAEEAEDLEQRQVRFLIEQGVDEYFRVVSKNGIALIQSEDGRTWYFEPESSVGCELTSENLVSAEVIEDGDTIAHAHRGRQIGSAMVGGLVAGGVGALIGGLGAKKSNRTKISKISLKLTLRDFYSPIVELVFFSWPGGVEASYLTTEARNEASEWCARLEIPMRADPSVPKQEIQTSATNIDQLTQWVGMLEAGHITQEDFDNQKRQILGS